MLCVGLTGGIGCGKSTVAEIFQQHGVRIIDTDEISRQLTQANGRAIAAIQMQFGEEFISQEGALNRSKMRSLIFSDAVAKHKLESLLHPLILEEVQQQLKQPQVAPYALIVVPLLLEKTTFLHLVQRVLVVDCAERNQIERVVRRSQLSEDEVRAIMAQQLTREVRLRGANDIINNDTDLDSLVKQVDTLHLAYLASQMQNGN
jgi:dephospho-CoA kinase